MLHRAVVDGMVAQVVSVDMVAQEVVAVLCAALLAFAYVEPSHPICSVGHACEHDAQGQ